MTETRFTWRWLLVIAIVGIGMGLFVGLAAGWLIAPNFTGSNPAGLSASAQNDYIVLVANTYSYDQDLAHARKRLGQLQDKDISARVERLAKALAARQDPAAANVADLAVALGSESRELIPLAEIAASDGWGADAGFVEGIEPTKIARVQEPNSVSQGPATQAQPSQTPSSNDNSEPAATPQKIKPQQATRAARQTAAAASAQSAPTDAPAPTNAPAPTDAPTPAEPTSVPPPPTVEPTAASVAPAPSTSFYPEYPGGWHVASQHFVPAQVAPGQQYWHLKEAIFCDVPPDGQAHTDTCPRPGMPGGENDHTIYVTALDESGGCADAVVKSTLNTGETVDLERKPSAYPYTSCNEHYERTMFGEGNSIWIDGLPSDRLGDLVMNSPKLNWSENKAHVRYILIFQRTTR